MAQYYNHHPATTIPQQANPGDPMAEVCVLSEYNKFHETLLMDDAVEGWASELCCYLGTMQRDVTKDTDLIEWWQVSHFPSSYR